MKRAVLSSFLLLPALAWAQGHDPKTPNDLYERGTPTFVRGTAGDDATDVAIAAQVELIRGMLFPDAEVLEDNQVDPERGPAAWPKNPVLYGGQHVNDLLARLPGLPFGFEPGKLRVGTRTFVGDEYRLIALVPRTERWPAFVVYAGAATPGVAEINGVQHGPQTLLVIDRFGPLIDGYWQLGHSGKLEPRWGRPKNRVSWRTAVEASVTVAWADVEGLEPDLAAETKQSIACVQGAGRAAGRLGLKEPAAIAIYVYPDRGSKTSITSNRGDGHADLVSRTLHVLPAGDALEDLVAHEATHVLAYHAFGATRSPLLGEGLAVWASGRYAGRDLEAWKQDVPAAVPAVKHLLGGTFRKLPEQVSYPLAGIFVATLVEAVGLETFSAQLYPSGPDDWEAACERAGTTAADLEAAFRKVLGR